MKIHAVAPASAPLNLLTLADPSAERVRAYLPYCQVFVGTEDGVAVAVAAVLGRPDEFELMAIAVAEARQGRGRGRQMLKHVLAFATANGAKRLVVGTGNSSLREQAFYRQNGFERTGVIESFFKDYDPPIVENGIRCLDMVRFSRETKPAGPSENNAAQSNRTNSAG